MYTAAAAKSLQSCPTLCDPIDVSPPGSAAPGILQAHPQATHVCNRPKGPLRTELQYKEPHGSMCESKPLPSSPDLDHSLVTPSPCILASPRPCEHWRSRDHPTTPGRTLAVSQCGLQAASQPPDLPKSEPKNNKHKEMGSN